MGSHVAECLCQVVGTGDDSVFTYHDGADGYFTCLVSDLGLVECHSHIAFVIILLFHAAKLQKKLYLCKRIMDFKIIHIDETDSTNRWLRDRENSFVTSADITKEPSLCVVADYQTAGKGCGANSWESERGKNLTFSLLLHPEEIPASCQFRISEAVSVALCRTLESYIYNKVEIKWPNDIYVGDRKICGILIENRLLGSTIKDSIVGIGLNVNQASFLSDAPNPVSLFQLLGKEVDREELLDAFLKTLNDVFAMDIETLSAAYRHRLYRQEGYYDYEDANGLFRAKLQNVLTDGRLVLLDTEGKARFYAFKEVSFIIE